MRLAPPDGPRYTESDGNAGIENATRKRSRSDACSTTQVTIDAQLSHTSPKFVAIWQGDCERELKACSKSQAKSMLSFWYQRRTQSYAVFEQTASLASVFRKKKAVKKTTRNGFHLRVSIESECSFRKNQR